ncbi:MAG: amidohydrolase family protein [Fusobacteriaceae bacterium]|jgi:imidazolonepropionase-like amidohydrolase|nr:amidohydrolase family protein [Fusobacteriaceae bacterium]
MDNLLIKAKNIIAGKELKVIKNAGILIENGKISKIYEDISKIKISDNFKIIDAEGDTIIPGMIDCHNHLALDARLQNHLVKMNDCEAEQTIRALKTMKDDLYSGVTTARCCGDRFYIDVACRQAQKEGRIIGPRLIVSGIGMRSLHGHGYVGMPHCGPEEFRKTSRENIEKGVNFLKVFMTKVINATPFIYHFLTMEELNVVVTEAKSVGISTSCHCSGGQGLDACLTAGIDCLEHVYYITKKQIEQVKEKDRWVVYTPSYALNDELLFKFSPHDKDGSLREKEIICDCLSDAIKNELKFGIGTDGLHTGLAQEAIYISSLGAKNKDVLAGITTNAAKLCGIQNITGSITEGLEADLVILDGNPLEDIKALKRVKTVIQGGKKIL